MILVVRGIIAGHGVDHDFFSCIYDGLLLGIGIHCTSQCYETATVLILAMSWNDGMMTFSRSAQTPASTYTFRTGAN